MRLLSRWPNSLSFLLELVELLQDVEVIKEAWVVALIFVFVITVLFRAMRDATH